MISTHTATVQKRLPDRTMSDDFRIISDIRLTNLFCNKSHYPDVKMNDTRWIAEKAVALKTKRRRIEIQRNKRDVGAAFKRVKLHPDMRII